MPITSPHDPLVDRIRVRHIVPEDLDRLVESEHGDRGRPGGIGLGQPVAQVNRAHMHRALTAKLAQAWIRVTDVPRHGVL